jgi:hypothetical protein
VGVVVKELRILKKFNFAVKIWMISVGVPVCFAHADSVQLRPASGGTVESVMTHVKQNLVADQVLTLKLNEPMLLRMDQKVPVILIPVGEGAQHISVDSPRVDEVLNSYNQGQANIMLSEILAQIVDIQQSVQQKKLDEAYRDLIQLQSKYPEVTFLEFLKASILLLMGKKAEAQKTAEAAVKKFPSYKGGQVFLDAVKGKKE